MNLHFGIFLVALLPATSLCQTQPGSVPVGTPLAVTINRHFPMRVGQSIQAHLLYPIYADNKLLLPKDTVVSGTVVALHSDHSRRVHAVLGGDFTPFHTPEISFNQLGLPSGATVKFASAPAIEGTQIYRAVAPPPSQGGIIRQQFTSGLNVARNDLSAFLGPGKGDRFVQFIYSQLPYHPQRIEKGTSWTVELSAPVDIPAQPGLAEAPPTPTHAAHFWQPQPVKVRAPEPGSGAWIVQANLAEGLSSETSPKGEVINAIVAEPIYNPDHTVAVPQGATLVGAVNRVQPARRFGRTGVLSFSFSQLVLPDQEMQTVQTRLTGADSAQDIALNSEGQAKSRPQDKISIPIFLALLAARPLDQDHHNHQLAKDGTGGAAGLGLVGTIVGLAGGSPYAAAGIGYWGAARAFYSRWIGRGQKITFGKDTRIVVETTPRRSAPIKPNATQTR